MVLVGVVLAMGIWGFMVSRGVIRDTVINRAFQIRVSTSPNGGGGSGPSQAPSGLVLPSLACVGPWRVGNLSLAANAVDAFGRMPVSMAQD
jgi:hypothetical protein